MCVCGLVVWVVFFFSRFFWFVCLFVFWTNISAGVTVFVTVVASVYVCVVCVYVFVRDTGDTLLTIIREPQKLIIRQMTCP